MNKKFYFISGMPRSGSTLLCNVLAQNPEFHVTATSGCLDVLYGIRNQWHSLTEHKTSPDDAALKRVLKAVLNSYHIDKKVIFDKSRSWLAYMEMLEEILEYKPKILVPVRSLCSILSSFEKIYRKVSRLRQPLGEFKNYFKFQTVEGRCDFLLQPDQPVGLALNRFKDVLQRGHRDNLYFVNYEQFTTKPLKVMTEIYKFLDIEYYEHNFDNIEQVTQENDEIHGYADLHKIKPKIEPFKNDNVEILGASLVEKYNKL